MNVFLVLSVSTIIIVLLLGCFFTVKRWRAAQRPSTDAVAHERISASRRSYSDDSATRSTRGTRSWLSGLAQAISSP